ncbi:type II toxin-antitoxin system RelE/ParE family toxin [Ruania alba]|uniref:Toxin n=1 Tax=Ruania alba TaxID=648782 RepID=A0A1H5NC16_9MICO|nr:type II toxin-antitoxin system RelE/ParE family toxin [Ruania alba]SEE99020.1 toxin ParE1/3/4 [Ruania alba]
MTKGFYRLTPAAQRDLSSIWDYTVEHWDVAQAESYLGDLRQAIERVATDPQRGRSCDEIRQGYRRYASGSHLIFYRTQPQGVDVIRVLHQRMDVDRHL